MVRVGQEAGIQVDPAGHVPGAAALAAVAAAGGPALGQVLKYVKERLRAVPGHGHGFGRARWLSTKVPRTGWSAAAVSHSASVGSRAPAQRAKASASYRLT